MSQASRPKAALIELYDSHDETLYSQLAFLKKGGYDATLIISRKKQEQAALYCTNEPLFFTDCTTRKGWQLWKELWRIRQFIIHEKFEVVILSTAHGSTIRNLCLLPFPPSIRFYGILHGVNKLTGSTTQKLISKRVKKYFLLSHYMEQKAMKVPHGALQFRVFYPMFHPPYPAVPIAEKEPGTYWVCIPGAVEYKRRDYLSLLQQFAALPQKPPITFIVLGNGNHKEGNGKEVQQIAKDLGIAHHFIFFHEFVTNAVFHHYLQASDAVLPLIHPINADMEKYLENQISGSFNLAYCYHLPLLMHRFFSRYEADFKDNSIYYDLDQLGEMLYSLPALLENKHHRFYTEAKWSFDYQAEQYLSFLS